MKKKVDVSKNTRDFLKRFDALTDTTDGYDRTELGEELRALGPDPERVKNSAYARLRQLATHNYTSLGKDVPARMSRALRQLRPPTPEEEEQKKNSVASSRVKEFLTNLRSSASLPIGGLNQSFATAFRNRLGEISKEDEEILNAQQVDLDAKETRND
jgi:hypothetical protein